MTRYSRRNSPFETDDDNPWGNFVAATVTGLLMSGVVVLLALLPAWIVMLALGAAHDQWPVIPALGYWTTYILFAGAGFVTGLFKKG